MIDLLVRVIGPILRVKPAPPTVPLGAHDVEVFRASPRYLAYRYLRAAAWHLPWAATWAAGSLVLAVAAGAAETRLPALLAWVLSGLFGLGILLSGAVALVAARLEYEFCCYVVTDRSVRIRRGMWEQVEATLTYENVQNVRVVQGPMERLFGLSSVAIDTAGGGRAKADDPTLASHRGVIRGVENAEALRSRILARLRHSRSAGLGDPDDSRPGAESEVDLASFSLALLREIRDEARGLATDLRGRANDSSPGQPVAP